MQYTNDNINNMILRTSLYEYLVKDIRGFKCTLKGVTHDFINRHYSVDNILAELNCGNWTFVKYLSEINNTYSIY